MDTISAGLTNGKYSCPKLFINHRCFSGPFLNKGRLAELPRSVGPGKCVLVLKEVSEFGVPRRDMSSLGPSRARAILLLSFTP